MNIQQVQKRIDKLRSEIEHHRYLYHVLDKQEISDGALDSLKKELFDLEEKYPDLCTDDSPTMRVAGKPLDAFQKVSHSQSILSLQDAFSDEDLASWEKRNKKIADGLYNYFCELKFDGLTVVLRYEKGVFVRGLTRGDGKVGEDVTQNLRTIDSIPLTLRRNRDLVFEIRGEVVMSKKSFAKINIERERNGESLFANPRNIAAGSIRQLDPRVAKERDLDFYAFEILTNSGQKTHEEVHDILKEEGFKISAYSKYCKDLGAVSKYLETWAVKKENLPYQVDGSVVVVNDISVEKKLGSVGKAERWMIAYKFPAEQVTTVVEDIFLQVGRTGALTPVAVLKPVLVAGSTVSRATLHNEDEINRLDVRVGDTVIIQKAGDVIPDIVETLPRFRTGNEKSFCFPKKCPACSSSVQRNEGEVAYYCINPSCPAQIKERFYHFVSKKAFNVDGLGPKVLDQIINAKLASNPAELFSLTRDDLLSLERFAEKSADNLVIAFKNARRISLGRFLFSLGIRYVGEETSELLVKFFASEKSISVTKVYDIFSRKFLEDFLEVEGVGEKVAQSIFGYFRDPLNEKLFQKFEDVGIELFVESLTGSAEFLNKTFVITGSFESLSRDDIKSRIRSLGGKVSSSVSKNTDYLIVGKKAGSKLQKARNYGIKIMNENEFFQFSS